MKPPHAHIDNIKGGKILFGQDKLHLKTYKPIRRSIHNRPLINITSELIHKPEFEEVRVLKKKIKDIKEETQTVAIDMTQPHTYKMSKRLSRDSHRDTFHIT